MNKTVEIHYKDQQGSITYAEEALQYNISLLKEPWAKEDLIDLKRIGFTVDLYADLLKSFNLEKEDLEFPWKNFILFSSEDPQIVEVDLMLNSEGVYLVMYKENGPNLESWAHNTPLPNLTSPSPK